MTKTKSSGRCRIFLGMILRCAVALCMFSSLFSLTLAAQEQQQQPPQQPQQQQDQKPPADKTAPDGAQQSSTPAPSGEPASKPKHVITNDDIKPSPYAGFGGVFYTSSGSINDCDAACFDEVHFMAVANSDTNPNWRTDVLRQVELVRSDGAWQAYLHDLYRAHNKICQLGFDKQDELRRSGGTSRNLGPSKSPSPKNTICSRRMRRTISRGKVRGSPTFSGSLRRNSTRTPSPRFKAPACRVASARKPE
jgi:hypothetical protein